MKRNNIERNSGITLVALVITIIILLILVGITITQLTQSGLFEKTQLAKETYKNAEKLENETLGEYENEIYKYVDGTRENNKNELSLQEHPIGKWINGETIYSKTIYLEALASSSSVTSYQHGINDAKLVWLDSNNSFVIWDNPVCTTPYPTISTRNDVVISIPEITNDTFSIKTGADRSNLSAYITLNYIKNK